MAIYIALVHRDEGTSYGVSFPDVISGKSMTELQSAMLAVSPGLPGTLVLHISYE